MWKRLSGYEWAMFGCASGTLVVAILAWAEQSRWLPGVLPVIATIPFGPLFMMLVALGFLLSLRMIHRFEENRKADRYDIGTKLSELESRSNENLSKSLTAVHGQIELRLDQLQEQMVRATAQSGLHAARLDNLKESLFDRIAADLATDRRIFTRDQIRALSPVDQAALFKRHPKVLEWYVDLGGACGP